MNDKISQLMNDHCFSDLYKDAYGFRPRGVTFDTEEELLAEIEYLQGMVERQIEEKREEEKRASIEFEELISNLVQSGAGDKKTAIRWLMDSDNFYDEGHVEYEFGLPYGYLREVA